MKFDDKREEHLAQITLETSRIVHEQPILFLCGGKVDVKLAEPESVRGALVEHLNKTRCDLAESITLAEEFKDWIHDSIYRDLLVFESDIAHISSLIVIVLESAGALTELGLFLRNRALRNKILVFVNEKHYEEESFIKLGPLRHLQDIKESSVCAYPWEKIGNTEKVDMKGSLKDSLAEMRSDILAIVSDQDKSELFNKDNEGHVSFVIYEIVKTFQALKITEIENFLGKLGLAIGREKTKRLIFLLTKFKLIGMAKRGHVEYYYATKDIVKVNFAGKFEPTSAKLSAMKFYLTNDSESKRLQVIKAVCLPPSSTPPPPVVAALPEVGAAV
ncbi:hypothetical protein HUS84_32145 [Pseudomonas chlororaphis]|uniref:retron St85 family effector protein n=1 Tax=Pseudomonas chlororaphis TaxID=587753 RepID=UPI001B33F44C|nr:hypothetical protein [Pseudomonas chlororaphis]